MLRILVIYRLLSPGSEWRLHRHWFGTTALPDLLGVDARAVQDDTLYRCHDRLLEHKEELFAHLRERWSDLFGARYDVLLYDLTSTYFECDVPADRKRSAPLRLQPRPARRLRASGRRAGRHPRGTAAGLRNVPGQHRRQDHPARDARADPQASTGQAGRIWVMDRGIPTEEIARPELRAERPAGALSGRHAQGPAHQTAKPPWPSNPGRRCRHTCASNCLPHEGETLRLAESAARVGKERGMRRRALKAYWQRLGELAAQQRPQRDEVLIKLGAAQTTGRPRRGEPGARRGGGRRPARVINSIGPNCAQCAPRRPVSVAHQPGADDPELLWRCYMQLVFVEEAFRTLKGDLGLRPDFPPAKPERIEAHLFVAFLAYCLSDHPAAATSRHWPAA